MEFIIIGNVIFTFLFIFIIDKITNKKRIKKKLSIKKNKYTKQNLLSKYETYFFETIKNEFQKEFDIFPQINLASIIDKKGKYRNELFRNIDIGIFEKVSKLPILLIEINDKSHNLPKRIERDEKVKAICKKANIKLIFFYSKYENKKEYIIERIKKELI